MNDYQLLQEAVKIAGVHIAPILAKYELDTTDPQFKQAFADAFQAGVEYAVTEMRTI